MKKIAILCCLGANDVCAGVECLKAFHQRKSTFAVYENQDVQVYAFLRCSRCGVSCKEDAGMTEKLERLSVRESRPCTSASVPPKARKKRYAPLCRNMLPGLQTMRSRWSGAPTESLQASIPSLIDILHFCTVSSGKIFIKS